MSSDDGGYAGAVVLAIPRCREHETERQRTTLDHPDGKRLVCELFHVATRDLQVGINPDEDLEVLGLRTEIENIGDDFLGTVSLITMHDQEAMNASYRYLKAFTALADNDRQAP